jgi:hypothetical protein
VIAIVIILAVIGLLVGIFLMTLVFQRISQRHMRVLWLREETKKFVVVDFNGHALPAAPSAPAELDEVVMDDDIFDIEGQVPFHSPARSAPRRSPKHMYPSAPDEL